jgi:hypothetical protein
MSRQHIPLLVAASCIVLGHATPGLKRQSGNPEGSRARLTDKLAEMLATNPSLVEAKGMDKRTPLHCADGGSGGVSVGSGARIDA